MFITKYNHGIYDSVWDTYDSAMERMVALLPSPTSVSYVESNNPDSEMEITVWTGHSFLWWDKENPWMDKIEGDHHYIGDCLNLDVYRKNLEYVGLDTSEVDRIEKEITREW